MYNSFISLFARSCVLQSPASFFFWWWHDAFKLTRVSCDMQLTLQVKQSVVWTWTFLNRFESCQISINHYVSGKPLCHTMSLLTILNIAPEDEIKETLKFYYHLNLNDPEIARQMKDHYDTQKYGLRYDSEAFVNCKLHNFLDSVPSIKRLRRKWGLQSTRQQRHTQESITEAIQNIREQYPTRGGEMIRKQLRLDSNIRASRRAFCSLWTLF